MLPGPSGHSIIRAWSRLTITLLLQISGSWDDVVMSSSGINPLKAPHRHSDINTRSGQPTYGHGQANCSLNPLVLTDYKMTLRIPLFGNQIAPISIIQSMSKVWSTLKPLMLTTKVQYPLSGSFLIWLKSIQSSRYYSIGKYCFECDHKLSFYEYHYCPRRHHASCDRHNYKQYYSSLAQHAAL